MSKSTVATRLADTICRAASADETDHNALHAAERVVLDTLACGLGAVNSTQVMAARAWARMLNGAPHARILGTAETSSVLGATFANSAMTRQLDMNDCDWARDAAHPSDNLGACISVGEVTGATGRQVLKAVLIAFEVQMRTTEFAKVSWFTKTGWDHTTFVTLASAAAAGALLRLDAAKMANGLAIAASNATLGEVRVGQLSMMKATSAGRAAAHGVEAAYLASLGVTGPLEIFEGKRGLAKLVVGECDWDVLTAPVDAWRLPRTCLKQYPAAYIIHSAIDAALALKREHALEADQITEVNVAAFGWLIEDMVEGGGGRSRYDIDVRETADHSLPYCVAVSLLDGRYWLDQLEQRRWTAPDFKTMLGKVKCVHDPALDGGFPDNRPTRITVTTRDGKRVSKEVAFPKGDPRNPLTDGEIAEKFRALSAAVLPPERQRKAIDLALNLRDHSVAELLNACAPA
jgi:2-methylcitrate dehydratase